MNNITEKLKSLLALAANASTEHEASTAAAQAAKIAEKYRIDVATLEGVGEATEQASRADDPLFKSRRKSAWKIQLSLILAKDNNCIIFCDATYNGNKIQETRIEIIGKPSDVQVVKYLFAYLTSELTRLSRLKGKGKGKSFSNSYLLGAVTGIRSQLETAKEEVRRGVDFAALIKINQSAIEAKEEAIRLYPNSRTFTTLGARNYVAFGKGVQDGKNIHLGKNLSAGRLLNK